MYNEEKFISDCISSILSQDYPSQNIEIFFVDGMSTDRTREIIISKIIGKDNILLLNNPNTTQPYAMNIAIKYCTGEIIIRIDAHCNYPSNYFSELVKYLEEYKVDNVGGVWENKSFTNNKKGIAISYATASPFCVGNAAFRVTKKTAPFFVDTVPFGCFRKSIFSKIGLFDVSLPRGEDDEFNARIIKNGGKILLVPSIRVKYYTRENFTKLFTMFYQYGLYKPLTNKKTGKITTIRQLVPFVFVLYLIGLLPMTIFISIFYVIPLILYIVISLCIAIKIKFSLFLYIMFAFFISHVSYGFGYIIGIIQFIFLKKRLEQIKISR